MTGEFDEFDDYAEDDESGELCAGARQRRPFDVEGPGRMVPCRGCGVEVHLSELAWKLAKRFSEKLLTDGEPPLETGGLTFCQPCGAAYQAQRLFREQERSARVASLIREVKATGQRPPEEALGWLRRNGHADTAEAIEAIVARKAAGSEKRRRAGDL